MAVGLHFITAAIPQLAVLNYEKRTYNFVKPQVKDSIIFIDAIDIWSLLTHKLKDQVDVLVIICPDNIMQLDNIRVVTKFLKEHDFPKRSLQSNTPHSQLRI